MHVFLSLPLALSRFAYLCLYASSAQSRAEEEEEEEEKQKGYDDEAWRSGRGETDMLIPKPEAASAHPLFQKARTHL